MKNRSTERRTLTPAQRGHIVQRVIVDGWTGAEAAAAFQVPERLVKAWVADYRRHGMASLHHAPSKTVAAELVQLRLLLPARVVLHRIATGVRGAFSRERSGHPSPLRRSSDDRGGGP